jgi:hypothetical protein
VQVHLKTQPRGPAEHGFAVSTDRLLAAGLAEDTIESSARTNRPKLAAHETEPKNTYFT